MNEHPLEPGDIVECVNDKGLFTNRIRRGHLYRVHAVRHDTVVIQTFGNKEAVIDCGRFKLKRRKAK